MIVTNVLDSGRIEHLTNDSVEATCSRTMNDLTRNTGTIYWGPNNEDPDNRAGAVLEEVLPKLKKPPLYRVILLNDDYTPMEFVVEVLEKFFALDRELAVRIMLKVHTEGKAVCGVFTREVAETKAVQVNQYARDNEHPLLCETEPAEEQDDDS